MTTVFEFSGEASLSWHLTPTEIGKIEAQASSDGISGKIAAVRQLLEGSWGEQRSSA